MKKLLLLLLAGVCLLSGCGRLLSDSYVSVQEHYDPYAYKEETETVEPTEEAEIAVVSNYYELMSQLRNFVNQGIEHGEFQVKNYDGDREEELMNAFDAIRLEDPLGAYAIQSIRQTHSPQGAAWLVSVDIEYRHTTEEIQAIRSVRGNERAMQLICDNLDQKNDTLTMRISGFVEEDFQAKIHSYCLEHPNSMVQTPQVLITLYPNSGNVRVMELKFRYNEERDTLRAMQSECESVLNSAERYAHYAANDAEKVALIYGYLTSRFDFTEDPAIGSVYGLLCEGVCCSESFAAVTAYLCQRVGLNCVPVEGTRFIPAETEESEETEEETEQPEYVEGTTVPYVWNIVCIDGYYYHLDFCRDALEGRIECRLFLDSDMEYYSWNRDAFPACDGVPAETQEASSG